ncbi:MAG: chorismate-binding protein [Micromonosporaceae bacterium]
MRTAVATRSGLSIGAGGAIVVGSDPEQEFAETMVKAQALLTAYQTVTGAT